jgi:hypothetical protein
MQCSIIIWVAVKLHKFIIHSMFLIFQYLYSLLPNVLITINHSIQSILFSMILMLLFSNLGGWGVVIKIYVVPM